MGLRILDPKTHRQGIFTHHGRKSSLIDTNAAAESMSMIRIEVFTTTFRPFRIAPFNPSHVRPRCPMNRMMNIRNMILSNPVSNNDLDY